MLEVKDIIRSLVLTVLLLIGSKETMAQYNHIGLPHDINHVTVASNDLHGHVKEMTLRKVDIFSNEIIDQDTLYLHFNNEGLLTQRNSLWGEEYPDCIYRYSDGRLMEQTYSADNASVTSTYLYTSSGCLTAAIQQWYENGKPNGTDTIHYTCDNNLIVAERSPQGERQYSYKLDPISQEYLLATETQDGITTQYDYDTDGRMIKRTTLDNGVVTRTETFTYNDHGDLIEYQQTSPNDDDPLIIIKKYTYDSHGNWITCTSNLYYEQRTITYYND